MLNVSVNVSDDLYCNWYSSNSCEDTGATYNKIDHVLEYVVEICMGVKNFFPEHRIPQNTHNAIHKIFIYDITSPVLALLSPSYFPDDRRNRFFFIPVLNKTLFSEKDSPPPKLNFAC